MRDISYWLAVIMSENGARRVEAGPCGDRGIVFKMTGRRMHGSKLSQNPAWHESLKKGIVDQTAGCTLGELGELDRSPIAGSIRVDSVRACTRGPSRV